jgi:hypothetical protein
MKKKLWLFACVTLVAFGACERPESPNFKLDHKLQAPLTVDKTYPFMGGSEALIDTTTEDLENLFSTDEGSGLIRLSKEEDFNFGDLNDAIPEVDVSPTTTNAQVGEISLTNFNSGSGNVGSADFNTFTGGSVGSPNQGDKIPDGSTPAGGVNIDFSTDYFESAVIKEDGSLQLTLANNLGFHIDQMEITLNSDSDPVGSATIGTANDDEDRFEDATTKTVTIDIPAGIPATNPLSDLSTTLDASWQEQDMNRDAGSFDVNSVTGQNLVASQVTAAIESQDFNSSGVSDIDDSNFQFTKADHFVELGGGTLNIDIQNNIDIGVEDLDISFPEIRAKSDDTPLVLNLSNIPASSAGGAFADSFDLTNYRIYAQDNEITYNIDAATENTQQGSGSDTRTINETDELSASVGIENLQVDRAEGIITPRNVLVNDDSDSDGEIDVFNDDEAETINIDGIKELSDRISDITFADPILSTLYETNLGVNTAIYAAIAGTNDKGKTIFLTGDPGSEYHVSSQNIPSELEANGNALTESQIIKFKLQTPTDGTDAIVFDTASTNSSAFFSNLPTDIRFAGIARINDGSEEGYVQTPVNFDPKLSVDLPFSFSAENATYKDTMDADLSDLPGEEDERKISQATFTINYTNGLPFRLSLTLRMLDKNGNEVTRYPLESDEEIVVQAAQVNSDGFVEGEGETNKIQISFSEDQLLILNKTRSMELDIGFNTTLQEVVKVRAEDAVTFRMKMSVDITSTVN